MPNEKCSQGFVLLEGIGVGSQILNQLPGIPSLLFALSTFLTAMPEERAVILAREHSAA